MLAASPGLQARHARLGAALLALQPARHLRHVEAEVEAAVRRLHGTDDAPPAILDPTVPLARYTAPRGYRPFLPCPLWGEVRRDSTSRGEERAESEGGDATAEDEERLKRRAKRRDPEDGEPGTR